MFVVQKDIAEWIDQQPAFNNICTKAGLAHLQIIWSDDLAIPWASESPYDVTTEIGNLLECVKEAFQRRGFKLNLAKNKTSVVATLRGQGAPEVRRRLYLSGCSGHRITFVDETEHWLHYLPVYKHLGTYYSADQTLHFELRCRMGTARAAFTPLAKPILCNRRLPLHTRFRLFSSLVESKLYFGCGAWPTPTSAQLRKLRGMVARMCRRIGGWLDFNDGCTYSQIFERAGILDPRIFLAKERLRYAMRIFRDGPADLLPLLRREREATSHSWVEGFEADLAWLCKLGTTPDEVPNNFDDVRTCCLQDPKSWVRMIKQGLKRHRLQERTLQEAHMFHRQILHVLRDAGATWTMDPFEHHQQDQLWRCSCGRTFTTPQGLSTHKRKAHGVFSVEHNFLSGATCPSCCRFLWSTQRLQQHLAYVPRGTVINKCFHDLKECGFYTDYDPTPRPSQVNGLNRADYLVTSGPFLLPDRRTTDQFATYQEELETLRQQHAMLSKFDLSSDTAVQLMAQLTEVTDKWFAGFLQGGAHDEDLTPLDESWIDALEDLATLDAEFAMATFLHWGDQSLPEQLSMWLDGRAEVLVEDNFYRMARELPRFARTTRIAELERITRGGDGPHIEARRPHRPVRRGTANQAERQETREGIACLYQTQTEWQQHLRDLDWVAHPPAMTVPAIGRLRAKPNFLIVHLFSGRRRSGDIHARLQEWASVHDCTLTVLSLDTADSLWCGDLRYEGTTWTKLIELYSNGHVAATISGSPCETFSAARAQPPREELAGWHREVAEATEDVHAPLWTRPLDVSWTSAVGLRNVFFPPNGPGIDLPGYQLVHGGYAVSEHPGEPWDPALPSIWRSAILQLLMKHPAVKLHTVGQWRWGASVRKPTGLLAMRLHGFAKSMYSRVTEGVSPPTAVAIGKDPADPTGAFRTAAHKEYPPDFCQAIAGSLVDQLGLDLLAGKFHVQEPSDSLAQWVDEAMMATAHSSVGSFLPDYQGLWPWLRAMRFSPLR